MGKVIVQAKIPDIERLRIYRLFIPVHTYKGERHEQQTGND